jgi:hypothetical protein
MGPLPLNFPHGHALLLAHLHQVLTPTFPAAQPRYGSPIFTTIMVRSS